MTEAWQAAALLEEIAKNADPFSVMHNVVAGLITNTRGSNVGFGINSDPGEGVVVVTYNIPVDTVMMGVAGAPEEVLEWLRTGLPPDVEAELLSNGEKPVLFQLKQTHHNRQLLEDMHELTEKLFSEMRRRIEKPMA